MTAIRNNLYLFTLAVLGLVLLMCSALVFHNVRSFAQNFPMAPKPLFRGQKLDVLDLGPLDTAVRQLAAPAQWHGGILFDSTPYTIDDRVNLPRKMYVDGVITHSRTKEPIPSRWFEEHGFWWRNPRSGFLDMDDDGFSNEDEWLWRTDPNSADSHPPYYRELFLKKFVGVPLRLVFYAYDGEVKKLSEMSFQIETSERGLVAHFFRLGEMVINTKYRLEKFAYKTSVNKSTHGEQDVSELTLRNVETGDSIVLPLAKKANGPESYAVLVYEWPERARQEIQLKKGAEFVLPPETDKRYKLLEINDKEAVIQTPDGDKVAIGPDSRL